MLWRSVQGAKLGRIFYPRESLVIISCFSCFSANCLRPELVHVARQVRIWSLQQFRLKVKDEEPGKFEDKIRSQDASTKWIWDDLSKMNRQKSRCRTLFETRENWEASEWKKAMQLMVSQSSQNHTERIKFEGGDVALIRKNMKFWLQIGV